MVCSNADNLAEEYHMVTAVMLGVGSTLKACGASGKYRNAASSRFKFHAFKLVDIAHRKASGQLFLIFPQYVDTEMLRFLEGRDIARRPAK